MYQRNNNFSQALRFLEAALKSALKLKDKYLESDVYVQKALVSIIWRMPHYLHIKDLFGIFLGLATFGKNRATLNRTSLSVDLRTKWEKNWETF